MSGENVNVQWFPGHMSKAKRQIEKYLSLCDAYIKVLDARVPRSSSGAEIFPAGGAKPAIYVLNKCDLADGGATELWIRRFREEGKTAFAVDSRAGKGIGGPVRELKRLSGGKSGNGAGGKPFRVMVLGIPNVGKSSLINRLPGGAAAKVENRPGVTRGNQWFRIGDGLEMLDTPGILSPKFDDKSAGENLAFVGAVRDSVLDTEALACRLAELLTEGGYGRMLAERYALPSPPGTAGELLDGIGRKRCALLRGGKIDTERAAAVLLNDFRTGKTGRITLELPRDAE